MDWFSSNFAKHPLWFYWLNPSWSNYWGISFHLQFGTLNSTLEEYHFRIQVSESENNNNLIVLWFLRFILLVLRTHNQASDIYLVLFVWPYLIASLMFLLPLYKSFQKLLWNQIQKLQNFDFKTIERKLCISWFA